MIITFCGHSDILCRDQVANTLEKSLMTVLEQSKATHVVFYCGGYGSFDHIAARVVDKIKNAFPDKEIEKILVLPYLGKSCGQQQEAGESYDGTVYPPIENVPLKFAIEKRNEWMVKQADTVFSYVRRNWGGAAKTLLYAKRKKKSIIEI